MINDKIYKRHNNNVMIYLDLKAREKEIDKKIKEQTSDAKKNIVNNFNIKNQLKFLKKDILSKIIYSKYNVYQEDYKSSILKCETDVIFNLYYFINKGNIENTFISSLLRIDQSSFGLSNRDVISSILKEEEVERTAIILNNYDIDIDYFHKEISKYDSNDLMKDISSMTKFFKDNEINEWSDKVSIILFAINFICGSNKNEKMLSDRANSFDNEGYQKLSFHKKTSFELLLALDHDIHKEKNDLFYITSIKKIHVLTTFISMLQN